MTSSGDVSGGGFNVISSYGPISPSTVRYNVAWVVRSIGDVDDVGSYIDSYGKYSIRLYIIRIDKYNLVFI